MDSTQGLLVSLCFVFESQDGTTLTVHLPVYLTVFCKKMSKKY